MNRYHVVVCTLIIFCTSSNLLAQLHLKIPLPRVTTTQKTPPEKKTPSSRTEKIKGALTTWKKRELFSKVHKLIGIAKNVAMPLQMLPKLYNELMEKYLFKRAESYFEKAESIFFEEELQEGEAPLPEEFKETYSLFRPDVVGWIRKNIDSRVRGTIHIMFRKFLIPFLAPYLDLPAHKLLYSTYYINRTIQDPLNFFTLANHFHREYLIKRVLYDKKKQATIQKTIKNSYKKLFQDVIEMINMKEKETQFLTDFDAHILPIFIALLQDKELPRNQYTEEIKKVDKEQLQMDIAYAFESIIKEFHNEEYVEFQQSEQNITKAENYPLYLKKQILPPLILTSDYLKSAIEKQGITVNEESVKPGGEAYEYLNNLGEKITTATQAVQKAYKIYIATISLADALLGSIEMAQMEEAASYTHIFKNAEKYVTAFDKILDAYEIEPYDLAIPMALEKALLNIGLPDIITDDLKKLRSDKKIPETDLEKTLGALRFISQFYQSIHSKFTKYFVKKLDEEGAPIWELDAKKVMFLAAEIVTPSIKLWLIEKFTEMIEERFGISKLKAKSLAGIFISTASTLFTGITAQSGEQQALSRKMTPEKHLGPIKAQQATLLQPPSSPAQKMPALTF